MVEKKNTTTKNTALTVNVLDMNGKAKGKASLPKELFGAKINENLMTQAVYVYLANQRRGTVAQKTRGEINASKKKIYRQKGTGRARHGALSAPIFVGGGVTFAASPREFAKKLSKKMRMQALSSALTLKLQDKKVVVVDTEKVSGKTKEIAEMIKNVKVDSESNEAKESLKKANLKNLLMVINKEDKLLRRAARNLEGVKILPADSVNTYEVLKNKNIIMTKKAVEALQSHFIEKKEN